MSEGPKKKNNLRWVLLGLGLLLLYALVSPVISIFRQPPHGKATARAQASQTVVAIKRYRNEYGSLPTGGNAQIMVTLMGGNPRKIIFFEPAAVPKSFDSFNAQGELIDPWKTPYRFDLSDPEKPRAWSCGPNRRDDGGAEGSDDQTSWR